MTIPLQWFLFPILALALYWPSLAGEFIYDDDSIADDWVQPKWDVWREPRPLTILIYRLTHRWPGTRRGHHVTNVLFHALNSILIYKVAAQIGVNPWIASLLFLSHPFAVNAVAYISGLSSIITTASGLIMCLALLNGDLWFAGFALIASTLTKPDGIAFLLAAILIALQTGQVRFAEAGAVILALGTIPAILYLRRWYNPEAQAKVHMKEGFPGPLPQPEHAMTVLVHTLRLIPLWMFGFGTANKHGGGITVSFNDEVGAYLGLGALIVAGWFFPIPVTLILCGPWLVYVVFRIHEPLAEYRNYAIVAGFALLLAHAAMWSLPWLVWFAYRSWALSHSYRTAEAFWERATTTGLGDKSLAWHNLATYYWQKGRLEKAIEAAQQAIALNPNANSPLNNLASWFLESGKPDEALRHMQLAAELGRDNAFYWEKLAVMYQMQNRLTEAGKAIRRAIDVESSAQRLNRAGILEYMQGWPQSAVVYFRDAEQAVPSNHAYRFNLAIAEKALGHDVTEIVKTLPAQLKLTDDMIPPQMQEGIRS